MDHQEGLGVDSEAEAFLARVATEAPVAVFVAEAATGTVVGVNDAATELFDRSRSSLVGMNQTELHPPEAAERYREAFDAIREGDRTAAFADGEDAIRIQRRDGTAVPVDASSTAVRHEGTTYAVIACRDATGRLERSERLRRQAAAMDISPAGIALLNGDGVYTELNDAHVSMFGYDSPDELRGGTWRQLYDDEAVSRIEREVLPVVEETGAWDGELVGRRKDGSPIVQRVSLATLPDGGLACVNLDLTARERTRRRLAETRELVERVMTADDRESAIGRIVDAITDIVDRPLAGYWTVDEAAEALVPVEVSAESHEAVDGLPTFRPGESLAWEAFEAGEPAYYPDLATESGTYSDDTTMGSELIVPVGDDGVLLVGSLRADDLPSEDREVVLIIARHLQTALRLADRRRRLREARERVEAEREQLKRVIDTVPQLIFAKNTEGEFILANEAVAEAYGTSASDLIGSTDADYAHDAAEVEAFTEDDRRVIERGEPLHRTEERLTDAEGTERVLETWKIPFTPTDSDEPAVLGVANDITELTDVRDELRRQRQLTNLYAVSNRVFQSATPSEAFEACVDAVADVVANDSVAIYGRDDADGALVRKAVADGASGKRFPDRVEPGVGDAWRAFRQSRPQWLDEAALRGESRDDGESTAEGGRGATDPDASNETLLTVSLDENGLLAVAVAERDDDLASFIQAVARQVAAALTQLEQRRSIRALSDDVAETRRRAERRRKLQTAIVEAVEAITAARTREAVSAAVVSFGERIAEYAFAGRYDPVEDRVRPTDVSAPGGPAKLYDRAERFPAAVAGAENAVRRVSDGRDSDHGEWLSQLLYFGYRSSIAVPLSHRGTVHGVAEFVSTRAGRFEGAERRAIEAVSEAAGLRLAELSESGSNGATVVFDVECRDPATLFPDLPRGGSIVVDHVSVTGADTLFLDGRVEGYVEATVRDYVAGTPGLELDSIRRTGEGPYDVSVRVGGGGDRIGAVADVLSWTDVRLTGVRGRAGADVLEFRTTDPTRVAAVRERLAEAVGSCSLISKRHVDDTRARVDRVGADLTDRQREVLETAVREGYYDDPRGVSGTELAERFDVSSSTLHQHLRAAESKVLREFLAR